MAKVIESVPESISREDYIEMFTKYGFTPSNTVSLKFTNRGVYAKVFERDADGRKIIAGDGDGNGRHHAVVHEIFVPVLPLLEYGEMKKMSAKL